MKLRMDDYQRLKNKYGEGAYAVNKGNFHLIEVYSSGIPSLDRALGIGGYPKGHFIELFGDEGSGKTVVGLQAIREAQLNNNESVSAIIDSDHALNLDFINKMGINSENLIMQQPSTAEEAFESVLLLLEAKAVDIIFIDSIPSLLPKSEVGARYEDIDVYEHSRILNNFLDEAMKLLKESNTLIIFSNQTRSGMGNSYDRTVGGKRLTYYNTIRIKLELENPIIYNNSVYGHTVSATVIMNKITNKVNFAYFDVYFDQGIDYIKSLILEMLSFGIVRDINGEFWYQGTYCGNSGRELVENIRRDKDMRLMMFQDLYDKILEVANL